MYEFEYRFRRSDDGLYDQNRSRGELWGFELSLNDILGNG